MGSKYRNTPLFGGAITVELPSKFADVRYAPSSKLPSTTMECANRQFSLQTYSQLREVPDHQEVYIDKDGFTSIIVEITERVGSKGASSLEDDGRALTTHLEELVGDDIDTVKVWNTTETQFTSIP